MPRKQFIHSGYQIMWLFAIFDLPTTTKKQRGDAARFRNFLLNNGFTMFQYSVYGRPCGNESYEETQRKLIREALPPLGEIRLFSLTDRQMAKMENYVGRVRKESEKDEQFMLF